MASLVTLNASNVSPIQNNVYNLNFPTGSVNFENAEIAVSSIIIPYSWYNVSSVYNNQSFSIIMPVGASNTTMNLTIPQGFYTLEQINSYIQSQLIAQGYYLVNSQGQNVYYIEIVGNLNLNSTQLNCYGIPTSTPVGYTNPASWSLPTIQRCPQLVIPSNNFGLLIGFASSTFPSVQQSSTYSITSTFTPQITPVTSIYCACSLVKNKYSNPTNIIANIGITSTFATQIIFNPSNFIWLPVLTGNTPSIKITFYDQLYNNLPILDTNLTVNLLIREKK